LPDLGGERHTDLSMPSSIWLDAAGRPVPTRPCRRCGAPLPILEELSLEEAQDSRAGPPVALTLPRSHAPRGLFTPRVRADVAHDRADRVRTLHRHCAQTVPVRVSNGAAPRRRAPHGKEKPSDKFVTYRRGVMFSAECEASALPTELIVRDVNITRGFPGASTPAAHRRRAPARAGPARVRSGEWVC
jgi:hypothetical protein